MRLYRDNQMDFGIALELLNVYNKLHCGSLVGKGVSTDAAVTRNVEVRRKR